MRPPFSNPDKKIVMIVLPTTLSASPPSLSSNSTLSVTETGKIEEIFNALSSSYRVDIYDKSEVKNYLSKYFGLTNILLSVCEDLRTVFKEPHQILLKIYHDPEIDYEYLSLCLRLTDYNSDFMEKIEIIEDSYADEIIKSNGWLLIITDFKTPQD